MSGPGHPPSGIDRPTNNPNDRSIDRLQQIGIDLQESYLAERVDLERHTVVPELAGNDAFDALEGTPHDPAASPDNGKWIAVEDGPTVESNADLLQLAQEPLLVPHDDDLANALG